MYFSKAVLTTHCFVPTRELTAEGRELLRDTFTVRPYFSDSEPVPVYTEREDWFGLPMFYKPPEVLAEKVIDRRVVGSEIDFRMVSGLRDEQVPVQKRFDKWVAAGKTGLIFEARPGFGKTVMLIRLLQGLGRTSLIVVHKTDLVEQWKERLLEHTDLQASDIGLAQRNVCDFKGKKVVIGMLQSLLKDKYPRDFKLWPGVLVVDEVHKIAAPYFSTVIRLFPSKYRVGASATVERADGTSDVFKWSIEEERVRVSKQYVSELSLRVAALWYTDNDPIELPPIRKVGAQVRRGILLNRLCVDYRRTMLIAKSVYKLWKSGRKTVIMSDRVEHLEDICSLLHGRFSVPAADVGLYIGRTSKKERKRIVEKCMIIPATYGMLKEGTDIATLDGMVIATPQSSITQTVGRLLRICAEKKDPLVVDIVDCAYPQAVSWFNKRTVEYRKHKAKIDKVRL